MVNVCVKLGNIFTNINTWKLRFFETESFLMTELQPSHITEWVDEQTHYTGVLQLTIYIGSHSLRDRWSAKAIFPDFFILSIFVLKKVLVLYIRTSKLTSLQGENPVMRTLKYVACVQVFVNLLSWNSKLKQVHTNLITQKVWFSKRYVT